MNLLGNKRLQKEQILFGALLISCLYIYPLKIIWIDKFVIILMIAAAFLKKRINIEQNKFKYALQINMPLILISYLVVRDMLTLNNDTNFKTFRWFIVHLIFLVAFSIYRKINLSYKTVYFLLISYSIFSLINYGVITLIGYKWEELQGEIVSGSIILSIPFIIAILIVPSTISNTNNSREISLLCLVMISGITYQSRSTILLVFISLALILLKASIKLNVRLRICIPIFSMSVLLSLFGNTFHSNLKAVEINRDSGQTDKLSEYFFDVRDSALLFIKSRESDSDRVKHLKCGLKFAQERDFPELLFGNGANSFRFEIEKCSEFGGNDDIPSKIEYKGNGSRSVSTTILIIDYGLLGVGLLILGIIINLRNQLRNRQKYDAIGTILFSYMLLVANVNDILLVWYLLLFSIGLTDFGKSKCRDKM